MKMSLEAMAEVNTGVTVGEVDEAAARTNLDDLARRFLGMSGAGADRSWRIGADGVVAVAQVLGGLTEPSRLDRLRRRGPAWRVLHSVPIGDGRVDTGRSEKAKGCGAHLG